MKRFFGILLFITCTTVHAQMAMGLVAGVNLSNELTTFSGTANATANKVNSFKGIVIGPTIELIIPNYNIGLELGTFFSRKGSNINYFLDNTDKSYALLLEGYKSYDYLEVPVLIKWKFGPRDFKMFAAGGLYWSYALSGKIGIEKAQDLLNNNQNLPDLIKTTQMDFGDGVGTAFNTMDRGYTFGIGLELVRTLQLAVYYTYGTTSTINDFSMKVLLPEDTYGYNESDYEISSHHNVFSLRLTYLFSSQR